MANVTVWLSQNAGVWIHRGYKIDGDRVVCADVADARRVVRESLTNAEEIVEVASSNTIFCYRSQAHADRDGDGSNADATIYLTPLPTQ